MSTIKEIRAEIRTMYGPHAEVSLKGAFILVHLDRPTPAVLRQRTREFDPEEHFCPDCPLCQMLRQGGVVIFDDTIFEEIED